MDIRLLSLVNEPAGTYFLLTDNSTVTEGLQTSNLGVFFINEPQGPVNTAVQFKKGATTAFQNIFGKRTRKQEKLGNFGIYQVLEALKVSDVIVINLRKFTSADKIGVGGMSPNQIQPENKLTNYENIFNKNGYWTVKGKQIKEVLTSEHYLNFGNVGKNNLSYFVTKSKLADSLTAQSKSTLGNSTLDIEDYPALISRDVILEDTFVDVYIFKNTFDTTASTNRYYGQYFNEAGLVNVDQLELLANVPEANFVRRITGSLIPNLKNETNQPISIDSLVNSYYSETGLVAYINDDLLEDETVGGMPILNTTMDGYYNLDGTVKGAGYMMSYRSQNVTPHTIDLTSVQPEDIIDMGQTFMVVNSGNIIPQDGDGKKVYTVFENNIRAGAKILFEDADTNEIKSTYVTGIEIIAENIPNDGGNKLRLTKSVISLVEATTSTAKLGITISNATGQVNEKATTYIISRRTNGTGSASDNTFVQIATVTAQSSNFQYTDTNLTQGSSYVYLVTAKHSSYIDSYSIPLQVLVDAEDSTATPNPNILPNELPDEPISNLTWKKALLTLADKVNADKYVRVMDIRDYNNAKVLPSNLVAYVPRKEQFLDGSSTKQKEILDIILEPSIVKGLKNSAGIRYLIDSFKTFVEPNYKYQFVSLIESLDKSNKFVNAFVNDPSYEDLDNSVNPLFKSDYGQPLDIENYLAQGGNPSFSTVFLTKPSNVNYDYTCYYFGTEVDSSENEYPITGKVFSAFVSKRFPWDVVANATGILSLNGLPFNPEPKERKAIENFGSNPLIKDTKGFKIYGNYTGQKTKTGLFQIHNAELLTYIKDSLYQMSQDENFKKTTAQEFLANEVEYQSFMDSLATANAVGPGPRVICSLVNNPEDVQAARMKVITISYTMINSNDKVVFDLNLD